MVLTHSKVTNLKKMSIYVKEDNSARKFMSKAQAVEDSKRIREERDKLEAYKDKLKSERTEAVSNIQAKNEAPGLTLEGLADEKEQKDIRNKQEKIIELEAELEAVQGQGSYARKKKIQTRIDELKNS